MALAPSGELTSLGLGTESAYGSVNGSPSVFAICADSSFIGQNQYLERAGARKRIGRTRPATGMFTGKGSFSAEADPDNIGAILGYAYGIETISANASNPTALAVTTTTSGPISIGWNSVTPASMANIVNGQSLIVDTVAAAETVVVKTITPNNAPTAFYAYFTKPHASGVAIANAAVVSAYDHKFTLGSPRKSFTAQVNRQLDAINTLGNKFTSLSFGVNEKTILEGKCSTEYQTEIKTSTPATPVYSTLAPFRFESTGNVVQIDGSNSDATVQSFNVDLNVGLITDYPSFGNGRLRAALPETVTKVMGSIMIAFETTTMQQKFWGAIGSTGPQSYILPIGLNFFFSSEEFANTAVPYTLRFVLPQCMITEAAVPIKAADYLKQTIKFEAYESINSAGDDCAATLTNTASGSST